MLPGAVGPKAHPDIARTAVNIAHKEIAVKSHILQQLRLLLLRIARHGHGTSLASEEQPTRTASLTTEAIARIRSHQLARAGSWRG